MIKIGITDEKFFSFSKKWINEKLIKTVEEHYFPRGKSGQLGSKITFLGGDEILSTEYAQNICKEIESKGA